MATRLYFPSTIGSDITPTADASWEAATPRHQGRVVTTKQGTGALTVQSMVAGEADSDTCIAQYVSDALSAQEISGTVKGQFLCLSEDEALQLFSQCVLRIVSGDGLTVRGTLLSAHNEPESSTWSFLGIRNRAIPLAATSPAALTPVTAQGGDRLVIELGFRQAVAITGADGHIRFRDDGADLPENETASSGDPWMEFSANITFQSSLPTSPLCTVLGLGLNRLTV